MTRARADARKKNNQSILRSFVRFFNAAVKNLLTAIDVFRERLHSTFTQLFTFRIREYNLQKPV